MSIFNIVLFPPNHSHELPKSKTRYMTYVWIICENDNVNLSSRIEEQRDESTLIGVDNGLCI